MMENKSEITNFDSIVKHYHRIVFRTVLGFVHVKEDAEDLTQEVFINAYRSRNTFRGDSDVCTWLYRIAINLSLNFVEQKRRKGFLQLGSEIINSFFQLESHQPDPQKYLEQKELDSLIQESIDSLPEKQRTAFVLSKYDDLSQKEIASIMKVSEGAVEQLLIRAKVNLQKKLQRNIGKNNI